MRLSMLVAALIVLPMMAFAEDAQGNAIQAYAGLLSTYVHAQQVDFTGLCKDSRLGQYLKTIAKSNPETINPDDARLAFWINAYNAYNLKAICDRYPVKSMANLGFGPLLVQAALGKTVWDRPIAVVNGHNYTLKNIDHGVIRGTFNDPKIQFALYCGAKSCPPLRNEPYTGERLQAQLSDQATVFFNGKQWNSFDPAKKTASLSSIMNWNAKYFGGDRDAVLSFIATFAPPEVRDSLTKDPATWTITYNNYDLDINDTKSP